MLLLLTLACSRDPEPAPSAPEPPAPAVDPAAEAVALAKASEGMKSFGGTLKAALLEEMGKGEVHLAASACASQAPAIAAKVKEEQGVTVGRSSTKLRNPANAGPEWVQQWLEAKADEVKPKGLSEVVEGEARVLKPLYVEGPCLSCHGDPATFSEETRAYLAEAYPADAATGYAMGELRGVVWATSPVR